MQKAIREALDAHLALLSWVREHQVARIGEAARVLIDALESGGKVVLFGNGGSAADAQHIAAELVGRFQRERAGLPAIALTTDTSVLTSIANDYGFEHVFARQVEALARPEDVIVALSTSGDSPNVLAGVTAAMKLGCATVGLTGRDGGKLGKAVSVHLNVPHADTARVQEAHITLGHILCACVDAALGGPGAAA